MTTTRHRGRVVASVAALVGLVVGGALAAPSVASAVPATASAPTPAPASASASAPASASASASATGSPGSAVANLAHLDFLLDDVPLLPGVAGHTTYDQAASPTAETLWVYADRNADGTYRRVGGGTLDPATGHYGQGAFDTDDIARAVVVYVRDWQRNHTATSRTHAYGLLRELTYLQTSSGPDAGNVVLWQQSDGTLNPSPTPVESPDPSDSAESFWLGRTIWALGEAYPAFAASDPAFATFLQDRLHLAVSALDRQSLAKDGRYDVANGSRVPAWLIAGSTSASAEAVLGLAAYSAAVPRDTAVRNALAEESDGIARMQRGGPGQWPYGAVLPSVTSQSSWNAWAGMAPAALARAGTVLHRPDWVRAATVATAQFAAQVLTTDGPDNAWSPTPFDRTQIAYGADSLVESLVDTADATGNTGLDQLAGIAAGWFFGANPAGVPVTSAATGTCVDGIAADGTVNAGCGAESSIHTDLAMLALDAHPAIRAVAVGLTSRTAVQGITTVEAESGTLSGGAAVVSPASASTGSANWSGSAYVHAPARSTISVPIPSGTGPVTLAPVVSQAAGPAGTTSWTICRPGTRVVRLGSTPNGGAGAQGIAPTSAFLHPITLDHAVTDGPATVTARVVSGTADVDAVLVQPVVSHLGLGGPGALDLYVGGTSSSQYRTVTTTHTVTASEYDRSGRLVRTQRLGAGTARVPVLPVGFTVVR